MNMLGKLGLAHKQLSSVPDEQLPDDALNLQSVKQSGEVEL